MKKVYILSLFFLSAFLQTRAQQGLSTYTVNRSTGVTYTSIASTGTPVTSWKNGTSDDDNMSTAIDIGFPFLYDGVRQCQVNVSTNGFLNFFTSTSNLGTGIYGFNNRNFSSNALRMLAPCWDDYQVSSSLTLSNSIYYQTTGTAPNRVFTIEWVSFRRFIGTGDLNFQVKLFEATNNISFVYGTMSPGSSSYSYSTGLNSITLTGTTPTSSMLYMQQANNTNTFTNTDPGDLTTLPASNSQIDFVYGGAAPAPLSGAYTIPGSYATIGTAIDALNYNGTSGNVTFNVTSGSTFTEEPSLLQTGCFTNNISFLKSGGGANPVVKPTNGGQPNFGAGLGIMGVSKLTIDGIDVSINSGSNIFYGLLVLQNSNTMGSQNNSFKNMSITLNRANTSSYGILQSSSLTPANVASGANSNNTYQNITIKNVYNGIQFNAASSGTYTSVPFNTSPDNGNTLNSAACGQYNVIGDPTTPNDIGNGTATVWGISAFNQANLTIANTRLRNLTSTGSGSRVDGIFISNNSLANAVSAGTTKINNNELFTFRQTSTSSSTLTGIRINNNNNAGSVVNVFNNFVGDLDNANNTGSTTTRRVIGISIQDVTTSGNPSQVNLWHNSVSIAPTNILCSNSCLELFTSNGTSGPVVTNRNNIYANLTGAQAGSAQHMAISNSAVGFFGATGSATGFNNLYIANATNGFTANSNGTTYASLALWQAAIAGEASSSAVDPQYVGLTDLHIGNLALSATGTAAPAYITNDIDCETRPLPLATNFDMGADETLACSGTPSGGTISPASVSRCVGQTYTMTATGVTLGIGITRQWQVANNILGPYANVVGGTGATTSSYTTGVLAAGTFYYRLEVKCSAGAPQYSNILTLTVNTNPTVTVSPLTSSYCLPGGTASTLTAAGAATYQWSPAAGLNTTVGTTVLASPATNTVYTVIGTNAAGCTASATATVNVSPAVTVNITASPSGTVCPNTNVVLTANASVPTSAYCASTHSFGCSLSDEISSVVLNTLNNSSGCAASPYYTYFNGGGTQTTTLTPAVYNLSVSFGSDGNQYFGAWIDYNQDGVFQTTEFLGASGNAGSNGTISISFTVPGTALNGLTRLRIVGGNDSPVADNQACGASSSSFGETEDYDITISGATDPFTYLWAPGGETTKTKTVNSGVANASYSVTASSAGGCSANANYTVVVSDLAGTITVTNATCNGTSTGSINVVGTGGTGSYTYSINGGAYQVSGLFSGLAAGSYSINVNDGNCVKNYPAVVVGQPTALTISSITPTNPTCNGGTNGQIVIVASGGTVSYQYSINGGGTYQLSNTFGSLPAGSYSVVVKDANGCETAPSPVTLTDPALPSITAGSNSPVCINGILNLTATAGFSSYSWTGPNSFSSSSQNPTINPVTAPASGTYTVTGTTVAGCQNSSSVTVTVNPALSVSLASNQGTTVCTGTSVTYTATPTNATGTPNYNFFVNGSSVQSSTSATYTYTPANGDNIYVILTSSSSCPGGSATSSTITMTVTGSVTASVSISPSANPICSGNAIVLTAVPVGAVATTNFEWKVNTLSVQSSTSTVYTYTPANGDQIEVIMTGPGGCAAPATTNATLTITVNLTPATPTVSTSGSTTFCTGGSVTLTSSYASGNVWTPGAASTASIVVNSSGTYSVVHTAVNGCPSAASAPVTVTVNPLPTVSIAGAASQNFCSANSLVLTANATAPLPASITTYQWFNGATPVGASASTYTATAAGTYTVQVTNSNTCQQTSSAVTVTVKPSPSVSVAIDCPAILSGGTATLTATASIAGPEFISSYQWVRLPATNVGAASTLTTGTAGNYQVTVTGSNGCAVTSSPATNLTVNVGPISGVYTIGGSGCLNFPTIASAVNYINTNGVNGNLTFNVAAGYNETAPTGGYIIGGAGSALLTGPNSTSAARTVSFVATNTQVTAPLQSAGSVIDGIFKLVGADWITIQGFRLAEHGAPLTTALATNNMTEWGIALLALSATDGAQNNTIQNDTIVLSSTYNNSFGIYSNTRHAAATPATALTLTDATNGPNKSNKVYGCSISNVNIPVSWVGNLAGGFMDTGNEIGGNTVPTGNSFTSWGSNTTPSAATFIGVSTTMYGVYMAGQAGLTIRNNTLTSNTAVNAASTFRGIWVDYPATSTNPAAGFTNTIANNTVTISGGNSATSFDPILHANSAGLTALAGSSVVITGNNVINCSVNATAAAGQTFQGIVNNLPSATINISSNIVRSTTSRATTGGFMGILNSAAALTSITISDNQVGNASGGAISYVNPLNGTTGTITGISNTGAAAGTITLNNNTVQGIQSLSSAFPSTGAYIGINNTGGGATTTAISITNNKVGSSTGPAVSYGAGIGSTMIGINSAGAATAAGGVISISNNTMQAFNFVSNTTAFTAILNTAAANATTRIDINSNSLGTSTGGLMTVSAISAGTVDCINNLGTTATLNMNGNTIRDLSVVTIGAFTGITNNSTTTPITTAVNINDNFLGVNLGKLITFSGVNTTSISLLRIAGSTITAACTVSIQRNEIRGITHLQTATGGAQTYIANVPSAASIDINDNKFIEMDVNSNASILFIQGSGSVTGTKNINGNQIVNFFTKSGTIGGLTFCQQAGIASAVNAVHNSNNNRVSNITVGGSSTITAWQGSENLAGGLVKNFTGNTISFLTAGTGTVTGLDISGGVNPVNISNNTVSNLTTTGQVRAIFCGTTAVSTAITMSNNSIQNLSSTGAGNNVYGLFISNNSFTGGTISNNTFSNYSSTGTLTTVAGIQLSGVAATTSLAINQNNINTLSSTGASGIVAGINVNSGLTIPTLTISKDTIFGLTGNGTTAPLTHGISIASGTNVTVTNNNIYDLSQTGVVTAGAQALVNGINIIGGGATATPMQITNNRISDLKAPASTSVAAAESVRGIAINSSVASTTYNVHYNTIFLNGTSSGATFSTAGVFGFSSGTASTALLNMRNNIIDNESTPVGAGYTACVRRSAAATNNIGTWNNNLFYPGDTAATNRYIYTDGTNNYSSLSAYQTATLRDALSITLQPNFVNSTTTPYDLHLRTDFNCSIDGAGNNNGIGLLVDIDNDARRNGTPDFVTDIGADEFDGTGSGLGVWRGVNSDWNDVQNWCGSVPTASTNVSIPGGRPFYPLITTATPKARNISIAAGGTVTITGVGKLTLYGSIANSGTFDVSDGTLEFAGSSTQTIPAAAFTGNNIKNLVVNTSDTVKLAGNLNLLDKLSFKGNNRKFATAGFLTLKSTATRTASVTDITNDSTNTGNEVLGDVLVERFISARRAWRFLSVPTKHNLQTIKQAWQENQAANATTPAGFGIQIPSDRGSWSTDGFDLYTPSSGPSVKTYNPGSNAWVGIISTVNVTVPTANNGKFTEGEAYMTFVRGDRTVNTFPAAATTTILREKGELRTGNFGPIAVGAGQFKAIGNPYASAVDFTKLLNNSTNIQDLYYVWDPQLGTLGGYVVFVGPTYTPVPPGPSYASGNKLIESGSAFFVHSSGAAGGVTFTEPCKGDTNYLVQRQNEPIQYFRTNLYSVAADGTRNMVDGVFNRFSTTFSNDVDDKDAVKMNNFQENLGLLRGDKVLAVDSRSGLAETDTIYYNSAQLKAQNYAFEFSGEGMDMYGLQAFLEDTYLNTKTPVSLSGTMTVPFTVLNQAGSNATNRFRLVFKQLAPVPVTFTQVKAERANQDILVSWKVENESQIDHYEVEKSADGRQFSKIGDRIATGNGGATVQYNWLDRQVLNGYNYYRIRSIGMTGEVKYSEIVKINIRSQAPAEYTVYPNPVRVDGTFQVSLDNAEAGNYVISLYNDLGQLAYRKQVSHSGGSSVYSFELGKGMAHGHYNLELKTENNEKRTFNLIY